MSNGEVYNYAELGNYSSDVYAIIESYKKYGFNFIEHLDGEFAIVIFDSKKNIILFATDLFGTKPLYYSQENGKFGFSSYKVALEETSFVNIKKLHSNSYGVLDLTKNEINLYADYFNYLDQLKLITMIGATRLLIQLKCDLKTYLMI